MRGAWHGAAEKVLWTARFSYVGGGDAVTRRIQLSERARGATAVL